MAARHVQFVCNEIGNATCSGKLTISGCPIGKNGSSVVRQFRKTSVKLKIQFLAACCVQASIALKNKFFKFPWHFHVLI